MVENEKIETKEQSESKTKTKNGARASQRVERFTQADNSSSDDGRSYRIGIDVGGTFTHAVALDAGTSTLVAKAMVPTSHRAKEGVAKGIVEALHLLLQSAEIAPAAVSFIAHSTTQATNALLEGDLAHVGIIGMGTGANAILAKSSTNLGRIPVASGCFLETTQRFLNSHTVTEELVRKTILELKGLGCTAIAASEAFAPDQPDNEQLVLKVAQELGILATAGSEVSQLYGLKVRTRTAAINAGILPKMIESADLTERSVREAGISAPIMIMRSDGGVMDIDAMRKRPILSILSGPAAGVAAAMMFLRISDGVFLEVGGTSTDISAIANGRALIRSAEIGGHRIYMRTLDVRTVGVAGGSLSRLSSKADGEILAVGPRSAHIANLGYASFSDSLSTGEFKVSTISPLKKDPTDYVALSRPDDSQPSLSVTPTCAANLLGLVPQGNCASGNLETIGQAFAALSKHLSKHDDKTSADGSASLALATKIQKLASAQCIPVVRKLIAEHKLDAELVDLIGGGGGAAAIVPFVAKEMNLRFSLAEHADVISAIGVAMALIRETVERQVANPTHSSETILAMRQEVFDAVHKMGAEPSTIEVHVEIDSKTSVVRATASGATKMATSAGKVSLSPEARLTLVAESMRVPVAEVHEICANDYFAVFAATRKSHGGFLDLFASAKKALRILDTDGVVRLQASNGDAKAALKEEAEGVILGLIESHASWGDAGKTIPSMILLLGAKIVDLSGLLDQEQVIALARAELANVASAATVLIVAKLT
jgi:N-methylhydantoinase A/oxoprolinase/acetone carboxylase beta subunit